jgi:hypothetical protein
MSTAIAPTGTAIPRPATTPSAKARTPRLPLEHGHGSE